MTTPTNAGHWAWMINNSCTNDLTDVTPKEAAEAMRKHRKCKGRGYALTFRLNSKWLDSDDREALTRGITHNRTNNEA